jgi:TatD DNase family protein
MGIIDTHAHLYDDQFDEDRDAAVLRIKENGISKVYLPNVDSGTIDRMFALENKYPDLCVAMMGLHPCSVKENFEEELNIVKEWLTKRSFVAIGEIGIDLYWDKTFFEQQLRAFKTQTYWALDYKIPIVIHARESTSEIIDALKEFSTQPGGIFHCFSGTLEQAHQAIEMGYYLGIGGVLTFKKSGLDAIVDKIDLRHLVLETDAPYLAPVPHRGKRNEPSYVKLVAEKLAEIKGISLEEVIEITSQNAMHIFNNKSKF